MLDDLQEKTLRRELAAFRLEAHADAIVAAARLAIRLRPARNGADPDASRLGGTAALPKGMEWPSWQGRPQSLIANIRMSDVARFDVEGLLPPTGRLLFFYDSEQETWGFDPNDRGSWTVIHVPDNAPVEVIQEHEHYRAVPLVPEWDVNVPPRESLWFASSGIDPDQGTDAYLSLREKLSDEGLIDKMLGYPDPVQNEMQTECQLASNGLYCGDSSGYDDPRAESLRKGATEWRLLLQVDSEDDAGMLWGDVGRLYFWIREEDLRSRNFAAVWCILQCC